MRLSGRQTRFLVGTIGGWTVARGGLLWLASLAAVSLPTRDAPVASLAWPRSGSLSGFSTRYVSFAKTRSYRPIAAPAPAIAAVSPPIRPAPDTSGGLLRLGVARYYPGSPLAALRRATFAADQKAPSDAAPLTSQALASPRASSRLSGQAYLFVRPGSGRASLAAGGELGGSQAAARLAWRLNGGPTTRTAAVARVYAPLSAKGAEAALGLDWYPVAAVPVRVSVERRFDLDGHGRNAWSAYAAGGFYLERLGGRLALDGYGQAGVVGTERRDLFVDGALRAGRRVSLGRSTVVAGAGLWGAAQPGVSRLDVGPRVAATLPVARETVSLALEGRFRVAGRASPGSGVALTLAGQF